MKGANWKESAELIGIAAIVASLVFVGLELRQSQQIALNEAAFTTASWYMETRSEINANADVWTKGNAGEALNRAEFAIYENLIRNANTQAFWTWATQRRVGLSGGPGRADFSGFLFRNPAAREVWEALKVDEEFFRSALLDDRNPSEFSDLVQTDLETLDQQSANTIVN